jgi:hypothetical protein
MAYSFLIFDFSGTEDVAQQARHRIEGWKQAFRLDKKVQLKFDRKGADANQGNASESSSSSKTAKSGSAKAAQPKAKSKSQGDKDSDSGSAKASEIRMIVRLDFSDHEKLSHQRWLERIPTEEPFKTAKPKVVRAGDPEFETTAQLFDVLDPAARKNYSPA